MIELIKNGSNNQDCANPKKRRQMIKFKKEKILI